MGIVVWYQSFMDETENVMEWPEAAWVCGRDLQLIERLLHLLS